MLDYSAYFRAASEPAYRLVNLGKLYMPSGKIFCCDPFLSDEVNAIERTVPPWHFDVQLSIVTLPQWGPHVALAGLMLSEREPVSWQEATHVISGERFSGFRVDAGLACFMDQETRELFTRVVDEFYKRDPEGNYYDDVLAAEFKQNAEPDSPRQSGDWDLHYPVKGDPRNIAIFASGLGDGFYTPHWGLDDRGQPAMLVVDFGILPASA